MLEKTAVVNEVVRQLTINNRYNVNVHGSIFSKNGTADILSHDKSGMLVGIECKVDGKSPEVNQWRTAYRMLKSGLRYVVAQSDFDIKKMDEHKLPVVEMSREVGSEFDMKGIKLKCTTEVVFKD